MHRIDADSHVANMFDEGDPGVPRAPTQVDADWLNMVQEELVALATDAGIALVKGTNTQLRDSLRTLFVRATGAATQTVTGQKNFTGRVTIDANSVNPSLAVANAGGGMGASISNDSATELALNVVNSGAGPVMAVAGASSPDPVLEVAGTGASGAAFKVTTSGLGAAIEASSSSGGHAVTATTSSSGNALVASSSSGTGYAAVLQGNATRAPLRIVPQSAVSTPQNGDIFYDSDDHKLKVYANGAWETITSVP